MANETRLSELLHRWQKMRNQGQSVTPEELCADCPELATDLNKQIQAAVLLELRPRPLDSDNSPTPGDSKAGEVSRTELTSGGTATRAAAGNRPLFFPGYEILEELGRGGMGVVYKARQVGLNRLVAIKMVLAGSHAGREQLVRFRREAEAVARLQHPNIVQIYEIGEQDGLPFFSLEYVPGGTLAQKLNATPQGPRQAAEWLAILARAVEAAHHQGIVHRDLKPGNVLVAADATLKITDFGLAKLDEPESGGALQAHTQTGAIMGTPSYMAPEQASGRSRAIGPATDVYALGAILYEMLTGRPPFKAASAMDTLGQVNNDDPVSPRRLQPKVPVDLETICLKCLAKEPGQRYGGAGALAEDVQRFLAGQPILARPTPWWVRTGKWVRRRPTAAALLTVSVLAAAVLLIGGWLVNVRLQAEKDLAQRRLKQALAAVDRMLTRVSEDKELLLNEPHMEPIRRKLLEDALEFYQDLLSEKTTDASLRHETGRAFWRVGKIRQLLGQFEEADEAFGHALDLLQPLAEEYPGQVEYQKDLAAAFHDRGMALRELNRLTEAERAYGRALEIYQLLVEEHPDRPEHRQELAKVYNQIGNLMYDDTRALGRAKEGREAHETALKIRQDLVKEEPHHAEYRRDLSQSYHNIAYHLERANQRQEAETYYRRAIAIREKLVEEFPRIPLYRQYLGRTLNNLSYLLRLMRRFPEAEETMNRVLQLREKLVSEFPSVALYQEELAQCQGNRYDLYKDMRQEAKAGAALQADLDLCKKLVAEHPHVAKYQEKLAGCQGLRYYFFKGLKEAGKAAAALQSALDLRKKLFDEHPEVAAYRKLLAQTYNERGRFRWDQAGEALADFGEAIRLDPDYPLPYFNRGWLFLGKKDYSGALEEFAQSIRKDPKYSYAFRGRGLVFLALEKWDQAVADFSRAMELNPELIPDVSSFRAEAYIGLRRYDRAEEDLTCALNVNPKNGPAWAVRGEIRGWMGRWREAIADYSESLKLDDKPASTWGLRGEARAELEQWKEAVADFVQAVARQPASRRYLSDLAIAHLGGGDFPAYRRACATLYQRLSKSKQEGDWNTTSWVCSLQANEAIEPASLVQLMDKAVKAKPKNYAFLNTRGVALYRAGRFEEAIHQLNQAVAVHGKGGSFEDWVFLAMARFRLGRTQQARNDLKRALDFYEKGLKPAKPGPLPMHWSIRVGWQQLRKEAEALIKSKAGS